MTKTNTRSRIVSILLVLMMLLTMVPITAVTASAADGFTEVSTYEQLRNEVDKGSAKVKLVANIDTTNENGGAGVTDQTALTFFGNNNVLDLNGHTLKLVSNTGVTFINVNKDLTIKDGGTGGRIDFEYGPSVMFKTTAIYVTHASNENIAHLTVESGTLSSTKEGITLIKSIGNLTINGGKFYAPYKEGSGGTYAIHTIHQYNDNAKTIINGGEIDGVVLIQRDDSAATGTPNYGDIPVQIKGGTFKQAVLFRWTEKGKPSGNPTEFSPAVEIAGGIFEKRVNGLTGIWGEDLSTKLTGGTFKDFPNRFGLGRGGKSDHEYYSKSLGNSIIVRGNEIRTSCGWSEADWFKVYFDCFYLDGSESTPVTVIPNAWGMKSVTLDGNPIDYFKDWKGTVERMDNSTAHTLKFEWYPLAQELKDAGYSYQTKCEHYISGSTAVQQTDTIAADKTSHTITIPAGVDPKVYSYDLQLNLQKDGSFVGIMSNEHIVKLVVSEAPVVVPDPTLEGKVYYTSGIVYDRPISTGTGYLPAGFDSSKLRYQWQRSKDSGSTWTNIDGATNAQYTPVAADMGDTVRIRVVVTAKGYLGEIVGAAVKVSKAANNNTPAPPTVVAQKDDSNAYTKFEITNFKSNQEYVYTSSPDNSGEWPTGGTAITSATVDGLNAGSTYYIYTRCKETATHTAGSKIFSSSVLLDEVNKLNRIILTDANGKEYSSYGSGNTIYIKKGESMTLTATANPSGANTWSDFTFRSQYGFSAPFSVTTPTTPVISGSTIPSVTIHGDTKGEGTLAAEYSGYTPQFYGTWRVHVYENISDIGTGAEITVSPSFPDTTMYVGDTMTLPGYNVSVYPEGALNDYHYEWYVREPATAPGSMGSGKNVKENTYFKVNDDGTITAKAVHTGSEDSQYKMVLLCAVKGEYDKTKLASFYVTVTEAPVIELTGLTVAPTKVNLELNATYQLSAVKEPVNAAGSLNWESSNTGVATVDSTGKVTAKAQGTAIITVSCGDKKATCTVTVDHQHDYSGQPYLYLDPGNHYQECKAGDGYNIQAHEFTAWTDNENGTHSRHCTVCKMPDGSAYTETVEHTWVWVVDQEAALNQPGKQHEECTGCHAKRNENTEIPALRDYAVTVTGGTATVAAGTPITRAMEGVEVTVTAQAPDGKHFVKWVVKAGGVTLANATSATTTFIMPANDVTIEAECAENPVESYTLTVIKGTASVAAGTPITDKIEQNTVVTVKADAPETGKVFDKWVVLEGNVTLADATKATTTFTMPGNDVKLEATYKDAPPSHTHSYGTDWKYDDTNHWHECDCGDKADVAAHSYVWKTDKEATKFKDGSKHEECSVCGAVRNAGTIIPATLGHCWIIDFIISVKDFVIGATKGTVEFIISAFKQIIGK